MNCFSPAVKKVKEDVIFKMRLPFLNFPIRPYEGLPLPFKEFD